MDLLSSECKLNNFDEKNMTNIKEAFYQIKNKIHKDNKIIEIFLKKIDFKGNNNYEFKGFINSGGSSLVYKLLNKNSKNYIATKIILIENFEKNIINEIMILKKVKNNNIINFYGAYRKEELYFIFMEYAHFGNLIDFQRNIIKKDFSEPLLCFISYQILIGLKYLHTNKISHMDLKPQNILLNEYLYIKLADFSISLDYSKNNSKEIKLSKRGTGYYMAPEVIQNKTININDINKVDLYSLGVTLYKLAFGYNPFGINNDDMNNNDLMLQKILNGPIINTDRDYFSGYFIDFIKGLLEKDIKKRMNIYEALNHYWILGAAILYNEKEKMFNTTNFLGYLISDHIKTFDDYVKRENTN